MEPRVLPFPIPPHPPMSAERYVRLTKNLHGWINEVMMEILSLRDELQKHPKSLDAESNKEILKEKENLYARLMAASDKLRLYHNYGYCRCGREIEERKLSALPLTTTCRKCDQAAYAQQQQETTDGELGRQVRRMAQKAKVRIRGRRR